MNKTTQFMRVNSAHHAPMSSLVQTKEQGHPLDRQPGDVDSRMEFYLPVDLAILWHRSGRK
jgi:hypothetical protein